MQPVHLWFVTNEEPKQRPPEPVQEKKHQTRFHADSLPQITKRDEFIQQVDPEHSEKAVSRDIKILGSRCSHINVL
jgi:hypothetical protein